MIAQQALERKCGARGLRAIIEDILMDSMFEIPSRNDIMQCTVTPECVKNGIAPTLTQGEPQVKKARKLNLAEKNFIIQPHVS